MALSPSVMNNPSSGQLQGPTKKLRKNALIPDDYEHLPVQYLDLGQGRRLAYRKFEGHRQPTLLYVPGFFASMNLPKTVVVEVWARQNGYSNVRYDQECVGLSTGDQQTLEFEHWLEGALAMVDRVCQGPVILVASSVGSWMSILVTLRRPERIHGLLFLGPAFNVIRPGYWHHYGLLTPVEREKVDLGLEHVKITMKYGGAGIMRKDFCENTAKYEIDFSKPIDIKCPVRIVHAIKDADVPYETSLLLMERLATQDVDLIIRKTGNHRLMTPPDLVLLLSEIERMVLQFAVTNQSKPSAVPSSNNQSKTSSTETSPSQTSKL